MRGLCIAALGLLALSACGRSPSTVVLVSGLPPEARRLEVLLTLEGALAQSRPRFDISAGQSQFSFGLRWPEGRSTVEISVGAFADSGCLRATGTVTLEISAPAEDLALTLASAPEYAAACKRGAPAIKRVTQASASGRRILVIDGWGFHGGTQILIAGVPASGLVRRSAERIEVDEEALENPTGRRQVEVRAVDPGQSADAVTVDLQAITFAPIEENTYTLGAGGYPESIAIGDVNGDGRPDIVAAGNTELDPAFVAILLNEGGGRFSRTPMRHEVAGGAYPVVIADLDRDHRPDIAMSNIKRNSVTVLYNEGGGVFSSRTYSTGNRPYSLAAADLNGDGLPELVLSTDPYSQASASKVNTLLNRGARNMDLLILDPGPALYGALAAGDIDGNGTTDLALNEVLLLRVDGKPVVQGSVAIFFNRGDGLTFDRVSPRSGGLLGGLLVVDVDGDASLDLIVSGLHGSDAVKEGVVSVMLNRMKNFSIARTDYLSAQRPFAMALGDFDGDARPDLALTNPLDTERGTLNLLRNQGAGRFPSSGLPVYPIGVGVSAVAAGDLNGDGWTDLAVSNLGNPKTGELGSVQVLLNNGR